MLGAEVGQLGGFVEVELTHGHGAFHDAGIVVVHAVDVGPDLYLVGLEGGAQQTGGVVAAAAQQVVDVAVGVAADEALRDVDLIALVLFHHPAALLADEGGVGLCVFVRAHHFECGQQDGLDAALEQVVGHHVGGHQLALCQHDFLLEAGEVHFGHSAQSVEHALEERARLRLVFLALVELFHVGHVLLLQLGDHVHGAFDVVFVKVVADLHQ